MSAAHPVDTSADPPRFIGATAAALFSVGWTIGSAVFRVPGEVAAGAGSVGGSLLLWLAGALIALCGAFCYAELAVRLPRAGSEYAYGIAAWGPRFGFLMAWAALVASPASIAAVARAFADYFAVLVPLGEFGRRVLAMVVIAGLAGIAVVSTRASTRLVALAGAGKLLALLMLAVAVLAVQGVEATPPVPSERVHALALGSALVAILFAYDGFQNVTLLGGEVRDPARTFPVGLTAGMLVIAIAYLGINLVYFHALGFEGVAGSDAVAAQALATTAGSGAARIIAVLVMLSTLGTLAAQTVGLPRYLVAPAADGLFPAWLARLRVSSWSPANAIVLMACMAMLMQLTGGYERLITTSMLAFYPMAAIALAGAIPLRRNSGVPTGYAMPWYPLPLLVFIASIALICVTSAFEDPVTLLYSLGVPLSGAIVYQFALSRRFERVVVT